MDMDMSLYKQFLENEQKRVLAELERFDEEIVKVYSMIETPKVDSMIETPVQEYPTMELTGYPYTGELIEKLVFLENSRFKRFWKLEEMMKLIEETDNCKYSRANTHYYLRGYCKNHQLLKVKYNGAPKWVYYTTRRDWVTDEFRPVAERMSAKLSQIEKSNPHREWKGL